MEALQPSKKSFRDKVYEIVSQIPYGTVATYGQIAAMTGNARSARQVGFALRALTVNERDIPWWRVINREGKITISNTNPILDKQLQKDLLQSEGVEVKTSTDYYEIDLEKYLMKF